MIKIEPSINTCLFEQSVNKCIFESSANKVMIEQISIEDIIYFISYVQPVEDTLEVK